MLAIKINQSFSNDLQRIKELIFLYLKMTYLCLNLRQKRVSTIIIDGLIQ